MGEKLELGNPIKPSSFGLMNGPLVCLLGKSVNNSVDSSLYDLVRIPINNLMFWNIKI